MPFLDYPLDELRRYRPDVDEPDDFDEFWSRTLAESRAIGGDVTLTPYDAGLVPFDVFDVTFPGFGGHPIKGWLLLPAGTTTPLPVVVEYNGYGGGRGLPHERLTWVSSGYAYFFMDTRGQGSSWGSGGETPDPVGGGPSTPGYLTRGIEHQDSFYYLRVYVDAVRAIDAIGALPQVDETRMAVAGGSQGGGIAIAVAGLVPGLVGAVPDVPFLSHFRRAVGLTGLDPYAEVVKYLSVHRDRVDRVFTTLSYFDGVNFAKRARCPSLFSVALMDETCPPSTVFASHNSWLGPSTIEVYSFNNHEGGQPLHWLRQRDWLRQLAGF